MRKATVAAKDLHPDPGGVPTGAQAQGREGRFGIVGIR